MQAEKNTGVEFAPTRSKSNRIVFLIAFGVFMFGGLSAFMVGRKDSGFQNLTSNDKAGVGILVFGIALVFLCGVHFLTSPPAISYCVAKEGIILKHGKKMLSIPYSDIESLTHLKEKQAEDFIIKLQQKVSEKQAEEVQGIKSAQSRLDIGGISRLRKNILEEQKKAVEKYKFLSVTIGYSKYNSKGIVKKADLPCDTIFILQKNGEGYLISPLDIEGFMNEAKKQMNS